MMCNPMRWAVMAVGLVSFGAAALPSVAAPTVFFDRDDSTGFMSSFPNSQTKFNEFTATLSSFGVDDVESAVGLSPTLAFGTTGIMATTQGVLAQNAPGFQIGAQALLEHDAAGFPQVNTVFTFSTLIKSFGVFVIQGGDGANNNPTTFRLKNTVTNAFVDVPVQVGSGWGLDNAYFFGVTDTAAFNEVEVIESVDFNDGLLMDNIVAGGAVPEPGSFALVLLGGVGALFGRARIRRG
jgi:hypothetical protein